MRTSIKCSTFHLQSERAKYGGFSLYGQIPAKEVTSRTSLLRNVFSSLQNDLGPDSKATPSERCPRQVGMSNAAEL